MLHHELVQNRLDALVPTQPLHFVPRLLHERCKHFAGVLERLGMLLHVVHSVSFDVGRGGALAEDVCVEGREGWRRREAIESQ